MDKSLHSFPRHNRSSAESIWASRSLSSANTIVLVFLLCIGCSTDQQATSSEPRKSTALIEQALEKESALSPAEASSTYEEKRRLKASELVSSSELLDGKHHTVEPEVRTDGFTNTYTIISDYGTFVAHGDAMLPIRVHEINTIATLKELPARTGYLGGLAGSLTRPFRGAWDFIKDPVDTVAGIPKGGYRWYTRVKEMVRGKRGEMEDTYAEEMIGFGQSKREWAYNLKVNPYTTNTVLQEELNTAAWASLAGNYTVTIATIPIGGVASLALSTTKTAKNMEIVLRDSSPEDLRTKNRKKLEDMHIEKPVIKQFLENPWFNPWNETILIEAMAKLNDVENKTAFFEVAVEAESEEEAFFFQRMAEMLLGYHEFVTPGKEILVVDKIPLLYTKDQRLVFTVELDYGWWSKETDLISDLILNFSPPNHPITKREVWISGRFSPRAKAELEQRGWKVEESAVQKLVVRRELRDKTFKIMNDD